MFASPAKTGLAGRHRSDSGGTTRSTLPTSAEEGDTAAEVGARSHAAAGAARAAACKHPDAPRVHTNYIDRQVYLVGPN
jgi:hypothetical protein